MKGNLSVKQLSSYIRNVFEDELFLQNVSVIGEVFEVSVRGKYTFLTLKEEDVLLPCVCFRHVIVPKVGEKVLLHGSVSYNAKSVRVSFVFTECESIGEGLHQAELLKLKNKLRDLGYFDKKRQLPQFITKVCIITSSTGSVIHDFLSGIQNGHSYVTVDVVSSSVQGDSAQSELIEAISRCDGIGYDVIVLARGGGSAGDLQCFNGEALATAVANAKTVIISAIGHETDYTLCDFCADYRAGTPSYAAKLITENNQLLITKFLSLTKLLSQGIQKKYSQKFNLVSSQINKVSLSSYSCIARAQLRLEGSCQKINNSALSKIEWSYNRLEQYKNKSLQLCVDKLTSAQMILSQAATRIDYLNPLKALSLGYAVTSVKGKRLTSVEDAEIGENIEVMLCDGRITAAVTAKENKNAVRK